MAKVLLVEDDNNLREIFEMRLQAEGYQTVTASDGEEGLTVALKEKPDLIIADIMMPKLSGFDMVENLRATPEMKDTKVIMMTALGQAEDRSRGESLGVVKYLVKSQATLEDFARAVKEVLAQGGTAAQNQPGPKQDSSTNNNQPERQNNMQEDQSTNPTPPAGDQPAAPSTPPADDGQMSTADEQASVNQQINNFAAAPADTPAAPADPMASAPADGGMTAPADSAPASPFSPAPAADPTPAADASAAPADAGTSIPVATPPADTSASDAAPAGDQPAAGAPAPDTQSQDSTI